MIEKEKPNVRDAAAVILTRGNHLCWARRSEKLSFLGGYHAFPGGKLEPTDAATPIANVADNELAALMVCAARECFEETGVLLVHGGGKLTKGQRTSIHDDLLSGRMSFSEILAHWDLRLDARDFTFVGTWTTPAFSPVRFKTRFFIAECPAKQEPIAASGELEIVEFINPSNAWQKWRNGEILCAPPILYTIRVFTEEAAAEKFSEAAQSIASLRKFAATEGANPRKIEFNPHITVFPLKTLTLPPATHTNCFIVGRREFVVIDAAATAVEEQAALHESIDSIIAEGGICQGIIVSHSHSDHVGGEIVLQQYLLEKYHQKVPLAAHRLTTETLPQIEFNRFLEDGESFRLKDTDGSDFELEVLHTPGHASGHLSFYDKQFGFLLASDNVIGAGSVLIAPPDGNMTDYLYSLERMRSLPNLRFICGSHGAAMTNPAEKIENYIFHRNEREKQILTAWRDGAKTASEIAARVYAKLPPPLLPFAEKSVAAHLKKLQADKVI